MLAGILAIAVAQFALSTGRVAEPIIIGSSIFLIGIASGYFRNRDNLIKRFTSNILYIQELLHLS